MNALLANLYLWLSVFSAAPEVTLPAAVITSPQTPAVGGAKTSSSRESSPREVTAPTKGVGKPSALPGVDQDERPATPSLLPAPDSLIVDLGAKPLCPDGAPCPVTTPKTVAASPAPIVPADVLTALQACETDAAGIVALQGTLAATTAAIANMQGQLATSQGSLASLQAKAATDAATLALVISSHYGPVVPPKPEPPPTPPTPIPVPTPPQPQPIPIPTPTPPVATHVVSMRMISTKTCPACDFVAGHLKEAGVVYDRIDIDPNDPAPVMKWGVTAFPTLLVLVDGEEKVRYGDVNSKLLSTNAIKDWVAKVGDWAAKYLPVKKEN